MAAIRREISAVEQQYAEANEEYTDLSKKLRLVTQERLNTEEELLNSNVRLKQLLGELEAARAHAAEQSAAVVEDSKMTMGELTRKVESTLLSVLDGIPGVGRARRSALLKTLGSAEAVAMADRHDLAQVPGIGPALADAIWRALHPDG